MRGGKGSASVRDERAWVAVVLVKKGEFGVSYGFGGEMGQGGGGGGEGGSRCGERGGGGRRAWRAGGGIALLLVKQER